MCEYRGHRREAAQKRIFVLDLFHDSALSVEFLLLKPLLEVPVIATLGSSFGRTRLG
jgi:hypothetical protein